MDDVHRPIARGFHDHPRPDAMPAPTIAYVKRRREEGLSKKDIIRCLKRYVAREIYQRVMTDYRARQAAPEAA